MYKHPTDKKAQRRRYYRENREQIKQAAADWYEEHKNDPEFKDRKRNYMVVYRRRKKLGA